MTRAGGIVYQSEGGPWWAIDCQGCGQAARVDRYGDRLSVQCTGLRCDEQTALGELDPQLIRDELAALAISTSMQGGVDSDPTLGGVPAYPLNALPAPARSLVEHGEVSSLPTALIAGATVAALAAAIGPRAQIEVTPTWHERAILWVPLLAPRGAGKSPAQDLAFAPLRRHDAEVKEDEEEEHEPILLGDQTLESLARDLHAAEGAAALELDELVVLLRGLGEYKRGGGGDRGRFLALWHGAPWTYTRVGTGKKRNEVRLRITRPTLVVCGGLQPALHELLGGEEDGMRPRWLPHLAEMPRQLRLGRDGGRPVDWQLLLARELVPRRGVERTWRLSNDASQAFDAWRTAWKDQARDLETASTGAALVKADIHLARIALVLAEAEDPGAGGEIGRTLVDRAASIVEFTLDCWRALPEQGSLALSRRDETLDRGITRLIAYLEDHGGQATKRELHRGHVAGVRTAEELNALLQRYEQTFSGSVVTQPSPNGGIPTVIVYAPRRRAPTTVSPSGDTVGSTDQAAHWRAENRAVASGDTARGDTARGDTARGESWRTVERLKSAFPGSYELVPGTPLDVAERGGGERLEGPA